jgi:hypothetical protein
MKVSTSALFNLLRKDLALQDLSYLPSDQRSFSSSRKVAASMQIDNLLKKYVPGFSCSSEQESRGTLTFLETIHRLDGFLGFIPNTSWDEVFLGEVRKYLFEFWHPVSYQHGQYRCSLVSDISDLFPYLRPGPGSSIMANGEDFFTKLFASPLSATSESLTYWYRRYCQADDMWASAEMIRQASHGACDTVVEGSRFNCVPKNTLTGRGICTEPNINMMFQLGLGRVLEKRLASLGIDIKNQPIKNQRLARKASIIGHLATIDMKDASDSISITLLQQILPRGMLDLLMKFRSPRMRIAGLGYLDLPMVSTMGNGFTFPLMTLVFLSFVIALYRLNGIEPVINENLAVFGDDIICDVRVVEQFYKLAPQLGFIVNVDKSFTNGPFRESCGADYHHGVNVRSCYINSLETQNEVYVAINGLNKWSARTGIRLCRSVQYLTSKVRWLPVPRWESDDAGICVPYAMIANRCRYDNFTQSPLYRYYAIKPRSLKISGDVENAPGALIALYGGYIRNSRIMLRSQGRNVYDLKWNCAPGWDCPNDSGEDPQFLDQRWNTAVAFNLYG